MPIIIEFLVFLYHLRITFLLLYMVLSLFLLIISNPQNKFFRAAMISHIQLNVWFTQVKINLSMYNIRIEWGLTNMFSCRINWQTPSRTGRCEIQEFVLSGNSNYLKIYFVPFFIVLKSLFSINMISCRLRHGISTNSRSYGFYNKWRWVLVQLDMFRVYRPQASD